MIEWLALILLVPLILVPIVLLFGFAGCACLFKPPAQFEKTFEQDPLALDANRPDECIVQRIEPARLEGKGSEVRITLQRPTDGHLLLAGVFISQAADTGNPYDSAGDLTEVPGDYPLLIPMDPDNGPVELEPVDYALDDTKALLIAFDVDRPGRMRRSEPADTTGAQAFVGGPFGEAAQTIRSAGYTSRGAVFLVERIDVSKPPKSAFYCP